MEKAKWNFAQIFGAVLIVGLSSLVIMLAKQNQELKSKFESIAKGKQPKETLKSGASVAAAWFETIKGEPIIFDPQKMKKPQLFFVFSTTCQACLYSLEFYNAIVSNPKTKRCEIAAISVHDAKKTEDFLLKNFFVGKVYTITDTLFSRDYKITAVPQTLLINVKGYWKKAGLV